MSSCDLCGKEEELFVARIEGSVVNACRNCGRFGNIIRKAEEFKFEIKSRRYIEDDEIIVENYDEIIRKEREKNGLKQDEFALKLNERESVIRKIENKQMMPSLGLARKIEKFFGVKLVENTSDTQIKLKHSEMRGFTLGDAIKQKGTG